MPPGLGPPLYLQVKQDLEQRILGGEFEPGQFIPSEAQLQKEYQVSRVTVRQAVALLVRDGLLELVRGRGTRVANPRFRHQWTSLVSFTESIRQQGMEPDIKQIRIRTMPAPREVQKALSLRPRDQVLEVERLRTAAHQPLSINVSYLPTSLVPSINPERLQEVQSLYTLLEQDHNLSITRTTDELAARLATAQESRVLGIPPGDAVLSIRRLAFVGDGIPAELGFITIRSDLYRHIITLNRG